MSKPFERELAEWFHDQVGTLDPKVGDRYAIELPDATTAESLCKQILTQGEEKRGVRELEYEGTTQEVPYIEVAGTPLLIVLVRPSGDDVTESYEVSRSYATTIRNRLADGETDEIDASVLMIYEVGVLIETLDTTHTLFKSDGKLPLADFQERILEADSELGKQGQAIVEVVKDELEFPYDPLENLGPLRTYCEIYDACRARDGERLSTKITEVGTYLTEDAFDDNWFTKSENKDDLVEQARQILRHNREHADRIADAMKIANDAEEELKGYYTKEFIEDVLERSDWTTITRSEAVNGEITFEWETEGGSSSGSGSATEPPSKSRSKKPKVRERDPEFESIDIKTDQASVYGEDEERAGNRNIIASVSDGTFEATIEYDLDVSDEPISLTDETGAEIDSYNVDGKLIRISLDGLATDVPHFYSLKVYVGNKIKRGTPQNQFNIALVPNWFFVSMDETTYGVDVKEEALVVRNENSAALTPEDSKKDENRVVHELTKEEQSVTLDKPLLLQPKSVVFERLRCKVSGQEAAPTPINIDFLSEVEKPRKKEIQLPLMFSAIMAPDDWGDENLMVDSAVVTNLETGEFHSPDLGRIEIPTLDRRLLTFEKTIVEKEQTIVPRVTDEVDLEIGTADTDVQITPDLTDAYMRLFQHFDERGTVPSTDPWDDETQELVEVVLEKFLRAIESFSSSATPLTFNRYRYIGTIRSSSADTVWLTPFHPLMLAYGLRISHWRDELVESNRTSGFRFDRFRSLFTPVGLKPYRWNDNSNEILSGQTIGTNQLWASYAPIKGPGSDTPDYVADVVADKLKSFARAFPLLFELNTERNLSINVINMGDLNPLISGLYEFFKLIDNHPEWNPPQVNLRIYGGEGQGRSLEQFFATENPNSELRKELSKHNDEIVELLDKRVTYIHAGEEFTEQTSKPAHVTLFRGILNEGSGVKKFDTFTKPARMQGLLPYNQIEVEASNGEIVSQSGVGFDLDDESTINQVGVVVNALEASSRNNNFDKNQTLSKVISSTDKANLPEIWSNSLWVLHVEPKVDLDFYIRTTSQAGELSQQTLMIHYSDQYDASSPGFDVITTTDKRDPYLEALRKVLNETPGFDTIEPETVLTRLVAIDGELALDIQQAEGRSTIELLGLIGGLAVSAEILAGELPEYEWIPISLTEFARHDRRYRSDEEGLLQYFNQGPASDDLCFIGLPREPEVDELQLQLWVVETKGGSSGVNKGVKQIKGAYENLQDLFDPDEPYADEKILRSEFGDVISRIAARLYYYGVIDKRRRDIVEQHKDNLVDGDYVIELLEDASGNQGEVIRIQQDIALPEYDSKNGVRILKLPTDVLELINYPPSGKNEIHPDFDRNKVAFESPASHTDDDIEPKTDLSDSEGDDDDTDEDSPADQTDEDKAGERNEDETSTDELEADDSSSKMGEDEHKTSVKVEPDSTEQSETESETKAKATDTTSEDPSDTEGSSGYSWTENDFEELVESLTQSSDTDLSIDVSRLTSGLKTQFESLGVDVYEPNPADVSIGPRKIGVNVRPKSGQKIESVLSALDSISVHIQASGTVTGVPNPSKGAIRLEIPHGEPRNINIREGLENLKSKIREPVHIPLGVNTENEHVAINLLKEHHMLIGGATGSGKSNFLGACICSLVIGLSPSEVRLSLLDPKGIDFGRFSSFPHVDTYIDTSIECVDYLRELIDTELEDRRAKLQQKGVTSVQEYNSLAESRGFEKIPYRVIVIDEFADLIMALSSSQEEFEEAVGRLAQIGRALGYSILLATQRPDAEIVSGNIKTNFNCRVSFELPSNTDSRVILDKPGAEKLEGEGDMIALTSDGEEYRLQAYLLRPEDVITIRDAASLD